MAPNFGKNGPFWGLTFIREVSYFSPSYKKIMGHFNFYFIFDPE